MLTFISDLHIGAGDALDDFYLFEDTRLASQKSTPEEHTARIEKMHRVFEGFIDYLISLKKENVTHELILLGDIFDCLQVEGEYGSPEKVKKIIKAHESFFKSLDKFAQNGGEITFVCGNHDHEMKFDKCFAALMERTPYLNRIYGGKLISNYTNEEYSVYAEHGNQTDTFNRFRNPDDPSEKPFGSRIVTDIINHYEKEYPLIDNLRNDLEVFWYLLGKMPVIVSVKLRKKFTELFSMIDKIGRQKSMKDTLQGSVMEIISNPSFISEVLSPEKTARDGSAVQAFRLMLRNITAKTDLPDTPEILRNIIIIILSIEESLRLCEMPVLQPSAGILFLTKLNIHPVKLMRDSSSRKHLRLAEEMLAPDNDKNSKRKKKIFCGNFADSFRNLILGHYHETVDYSSGERRYMNTGTWKPSAQPAGKNSFRISQKLPFVSAEKKSNHEISINLCNFKKMKMFRNLK